MGLGIETLAGGEISSPRCLFTLTMAQFWYSEHCRNTNEHCVNTAQADRSGFFLSCWNAEINLEDKDWILWECSYCYKSSFQCPEWVLTLKSHPFIFILYYLCMSFIKSSSTSLLQNYHILSFKLSFFMVVFPIVF